jgi:hypothetical protein
MGWVGWELVALAGPAYFFLQLIMAIRYRGRWRLAALGPLLIMVPLAVEAGLAYAAGVPGWVTGIVIVAPIAAGYLLALAILKGWRESRRAGG